MPEHENKGAPVRRCLRIYELLVRHVADGMINKEIADATRTSPVQTCRDLDLLEKLGWVKKNENGRWFLTTKPLALLKAFEAAYADTIARVEETRTNINAAAKRIGG